MGLPVTALRPCGSAGWLDPRIEIRRSSTDGQGAYARAAIAAGEVVNVLGGRVLTRAELAGAPIVPDSEVAIGEDLFLAEPTGRPPSPDYFINHACDSNLWLLDALTLAARRPIAPGEEVTIDYALWQADEAVVSSWICRCGSPLCRGRVTGRDWRLPDLQARYRGHFSPFLNARIARLGTAVASSTLGPTSPCLARPCDDHPLPSLPLQGGGVGGGGERSDSV